MSQFKSEILKNYEDIVDRSFRTKYNIYNFINLNPEPYTPSYIRDVKTYMLNSRLTIYKMVLLYKRQKDREDFCIIKFVIRFLKKLRKLSHQTNINIFS